MQELERLLNAALANIEIRRDKDKQPREQDQPSHISVDDYRVLLQKNWERPYGLEPVNSMNFTVHVTNELIKSELINFMREELKEFIHKDHMQPASCYLFGGRPDGYHISMFLNHLLDITICRGVKEAVISFNRSAIETQAHLQHMALLEGIHVDSEIQVHEGIKLVPLSYEFLELPPYLPILDQIYPTSFVGKTLLVINTSISPMLHKPHSTFDGYSFQIKIRSKNHQNLDIGQFQEKFCCSLSLVCDSPIQVSLRWVVVSPSEFFNLNHGLALLQGMRNVTRTIVSTEKVTVPKVSDAASLCEIMANLNSNTVERLRVPIYRWIASKTEKNYVDKIIDLGIALEAIYLSEFKNELSFRLALHAAHYLGRDKEDRQRLFQELKFFYKYRSDVVHGKIINYMVKVGKRSIGLQELTNRAQDLCKESIMKIIDDGEFPDWDDLILS